MVATPRLSFTNSLDGRALCTPNAAGLCPDNSAMSGLIAYMTWLSEARNNPEHIPPPASPFPIDARAGVVASVPISTLCSIQMRGVVGLSNDTGAGISGPASVKL